MGEQMPPTKDFVTTFRIVKGADYIYTAELPSGCKGQRYRVLDFVLDVPSYQQKVLVKALTGKDKGLRFTCTEMNFARRYKPASEVSA